VKSVNIGGITVQLRHDWPEDAEFAIFSIEHRAWWRQNEWGYTPNLWEAGRFTVRRATEIIINANYNGDPSRVELKQLGAINEVAIPWANLMTAPAMTMPKERQFIGDDE
jgi:hypothetical protein